MKTRNLFMFVLTAVVCGAFLCVDSQARVCFATDENCGSGGNFSNVANVGNQLEEACKNAGYATAGSCGASFIEYTCPFKNSFKKCCPQEYRFEACIYPTIVDTSVGDTYGDGKGKCGTRYTCTCPNDYSVDSSYATANNCQPGGGYCLLNDGTTDTVKYKTCTCDRDIFTDVSDCKNNQTEMSSCTDSDNYTYKKCYCDKSVYPNTYCSFGGKGGTCTDSNSGREYYKDCKTAEEACEDEGYYNDCPDRATNGTYSTSTCYKNTSGSYKYKCENGEQCPYHSSYYKCVFSVKGYCEYYGYTESSTSKVTGATCTDPYGVSGTRSYCSKGPDAKGNYYYKCKVTCDDQIKAAVSRGELGLETNIIDYEGNYAIKRSSTTGEHLYLRSHVLLPKSFNKSDMRWSNETYMVGTDYKSVNGKFALYDVDSVKYSACEEGRDEVTNRPTLYLSNYRINAGNYILDVDFSDINIGFVMNSGSSDGSERFYITADRKWKNLGLFESGSHYTVVNTSVLQSLGGTDTNVSPTSTCDAGWNEVIYSQTDDCKGFERNLIHINTDVTIRATGKIDFRPRSWCFEKYDGNYKRNEGCLSLTNMYFKARSQFIFEDAVIYTSGYMDWDAADNSNLLFINSKGSMGKVWSQWNIGLLNSDIKMQLFHINPWANSKANATLYGTYNSECIKNTAGLYLKNSRLYVTHPWPSVVRNRNYGHVYISEDSQLLLTKGASLSIGPGVAVCIPNANKATSPTTTYSGGTYRFATYNGSSETVIRPYSYSEGGDYNHYYYYDQNDSWGCFPYGWSSSTNTAMGNGGAWCVYQDNYKRTRTLGVVGSASSGNFAGTGAAWTAGWKNGFLMPACYNRTYCGFGYNN